MINSLKCLQLSQAELLIALEKEEKAREDGKTGQGDCKENLEELEEESEGEGVCPGDGVRKGKVIERKEKGGVESRNGKGWDGIAVHGRGRKNDLWSIWGDR